MQGQSISLFALHMCPVVSVSVSVHAHANMLHLLQGHDKKPHLCGRTTHCCKTGPNESCPVTQEASRLIGSLISLHPDRLLVRWRSSGESVQKIKHDLNVHQRNVLIHLRRAWPSALVCAQTTRCRIKVQGLCKSVKQLLALMLFHSFIYLS